jgi:PTS system mannose-specific IID component
MLILGYNMYMLGYSKGKAAVIKILRSNMINRVTEAVAILGLMVIGAMGAERVIANVPFQITIGESTIVFQQVLDSLVKNIVPLGVIMATWQLIKRKVSAIYVVLGILIGGVVLSYLGILGANL